MHNCFIQGWGKYIDSVLGYKYKYIKNVQVQVQVQVQGTTQVHGKCIWYNYQVPSTNL